MELLPMETDQFQGCSPSRKRPHDLDFYLASAAKSRDIKLSKGATHFEVDIRRAVSLNLPLERNPARVSTVSLGVTHGGLSKLHIKARGGAFIFVRTLYGNSILVHVLGTRIRFSRFLSGFVIFLFLSFHLLSVICLY